MTSLAVDWLAVDSGSSVCNSDLSRLAVLQEVRILLGLSRTRYETITV